MTKNPLLNALAALAYIVIVALLINYVGDKVGEREDTIMAPIAGLSLFTLSAGVMGYIFVLQPLRLYFDGEKQRAVKLFLQTLGIFAIVPVLAFLGILSGVFS